MTDVKKLLSMSKGAWLNWAMLIFFFVLPWQTIYIFQNALIAGEPMTFGVVGVYIVEILLLLFVLPFGLRMKKQKLRPQYRKTLIYTTALLVLAVILFVFSDDRLVSLGWMLHFIFALVLFKYLLDDRFDPRYAMVGFVAGLAIPSLIGIYQFTTGAMFDSTLLGLTGRTAETLGAAVIEQNGARVLRAYGPFSHPNVFGGYLAVGIATIFGLWAHAKKPWHITALGLSGALMSVALLLSFSRSAWIGLGLAVLVGAMAWKMKNSDHARKAVIPVALGVIAIAFVLSIGGVANIRPGSNAEFEERSVAERVEQYKEFPQVVEKRWVIGSGPGTYPWAVERVFPGREWWQYQPVHNVFLLIIGELGVIGLVAVMVWASSIDKINFARFPNRDAVSAFMMGNVILVILFFDHYLWSSWAGLALVAYVMAMTVRLGEDVD